MTATVYAPPEPAAPWRPGLSHYVGRAVQVNSSPHDGLVEVEFPGGLRMAVPVDHIAVAAPGVLEAPPVRLDDAPDVTLVVTETVTNTCRIQLSQLADHDEALAEAWEAAQADGNRTPEDIVEALAARYVETAHPYPYREDAGDIDVDAVCAADRAAIRRWATGADPGAPPPADPYRANITSRRGDR